MTSTRFTCWIETIKGSNASNITFNQGKYLSITGTCIKAEHFMQRNQNLSEYLLDVRTTLCFEESLGQAVVEVAGDVFSNRREVGDMNPTLIIRVAANQVRQVAGSHLILDIVKADVIDNPEAALSPEIFKRRALELRMLAAENRQMYSQRRGRGTGVNANANIPNSQSTRRVFSEETGNRRRRTSSTSSSNNNNVGLILEDALTF